LGRRRDAYLSSLNDYVHMSADELKFLISQGWGVGNHSWSHYVYPTQPGLNLWREVVWSKYRLEDMIERPVRIFTIPNNRFTYPPILDLARQHYLAICYLEGAPNRDDVDLIILGRGGGSQEDLWSFNEEPVAREVFASRVPVISAVGHETDYVLTDFVADARAATPSHAAEIAVPDAEELLGHLDGFRYRMSSQLRMLLQEYSSRLEAAIAHPLIEQPRLLVDNRAQQLDDLQRTLATNARQLGRLWRARLDTIAARLAGLDPRAVLRRGYSIVRRADDGKLVTSVRAVAGGDALTIAVTDGEIAADVRGGTSTS